MTRVTFLPGDARSWATASSGPLTAYVNGWAFAEEGLLKDEALGRHVIRGLDASLPVGDILAGLNGNFAAVVSGRDFAHLGVDAVRSIPLFYRQDGDRLAVSDDARRLTGQGCKVDTDSAIEFATAGFVTGPHTLFREISGLQAGECVTWRVGSGSPEAERYYRYTCSYDADSSIDDLCEALDQTVTSAFRRMIDTLDGRQVVVPLSGGLDSRLLAATLKRFGY
ncbi:MAG: hypothetical protein O3A47_07200, partial [Chloroflexi bacterium]|nr:hypothetical protein [Chloroflexota bacterium]